MKLSFARAVTSAVDSPFSTPCVYRKVQLIRMELVASVMTMGVIRRTATPTPLNRPIRIPTAMVAAKPIMPFPVALVVWAKIQAAKVTLYATDRSAPPVRMISV